MSGVRTTTQLFGYGMTSTEYRHQLSQWVIADQIRWRWLVMVSPLTPCLGDLEYLRGHYELLRKLRRERIFKQLTLDNKSAIAQNDFGRYKNSN